MLRRFTLWLGACLANQSIKPPEYSRCSGINADLVGLNALLGDYYEQKGKRLRIVQVLVMA